MACEYAPFNKLNRYLKFIRFIIMFHMSVKIKFNIVLSTFADAFKICFRFLTTFVLNFYNYRNGLISANIKYHNDSRILEKILYKNIEIDMILCSIVDRSKWLE